MKKAALLICLSIMTIIISPFPAHSKCPARKILFFGKVIDYRTKKSIKDVEILVFLDNYYAMALNPIKDEPTKYTTDENGYYLVPAYNWPKEVLVMFCVKRNRKVTIIASNNEYFPDLSSYKLNKLEREIVKDKYWGDVEKYKIPDILLIAPEKEP